MASNMESPPESPSRTFRAGNYVFTRSQARQCASLHQGGATVWELKEQHHPQATLEEIVVAIQVGIMCISFRVADLEPIIFDPNLVCLGMWRVGEPTQTDE